MQDYKIFGGDPKFTESEVKEGNEMRLWLPFI